MELLPHIPRTTQNNAKQVTILLWTKVSAFQVTNTNPNLLLKTVTWVSVVHKLISMQARVLNLMMEFLLTNSTKLQRSANFLKALVTGQDVLKTR
jgi:hypothetical protein